MNKLLIIGILLVVVVVGGYFLLKGKNYTQPQVDTTTNTAQPSQATQATQISANSVEYASGGFSPSSITVKKGTTVTWTNKDTDPVWVASNPHPTHTDLPGFDAKKQVQPNETYSFTFEKVGNWGYHNHMNPSQGGTVVVTE